LHIISEGDFVFEDMGLMARIVELPGHTADSVGLHLTDSNVIFCGDAAMNRPFLNANRHTVFIENIKEFQASWDKIIALNPTYIYPGHGKAFPVSDLKKYRAYLSE
jgi:glyoxylase-like metal-dependent hydrolase (beta-lactamase superfamily II)